MRAVDFAAAVLVSAHLFEQIAQLGFQRGGVIHGEGAVAVVQDAVRGALAAGALDQQAVGRQLEEVQNRAARRVPSRS